MEKIDPSLRRTLITMSRLQNRLSQMPGAPVDLSVATAMRQRVHALAIREAEFF